MYLGNKTGIRNKIGIIYNTIMCSCFKDRGGDTGFHTLRKVKVLCELDQSREKVEKVQL